MKTAAFYENIRTGAEALGMTMEEAVGYLHREAGLDLLYCAEDSVEQYYDEIRTVMDHVGVGLEGVHVWLDFAHHPEDGTYRQVIDHARELGGENALFVPGLFREEDQKDRESREKFYANIVEGLTRAAAYGRANGIQVSIEGLDNLDSPLVTPEGVKYFLDRVPDLYCSYDTGNFAQCHADELAALPQFDGKLCNFHIKDRSRKPHYPDCAPLACDNGEQIYMTPAGTGFIQMKEVLQHLKSIGYDGTFVVEMYTYSPEHMLEGIRDAIRWTLNTWAVL